MNLNTLAKILKLEQTTITEDEIHCCCPLAPWTHEKGTDSSPSFSFKRMPNKAVIYNCFSCKSSGTVEGLLPILYEKTHNLDYMRAMLDIESHIEVEYKDETSYSKDLILRKDIYEYIFEDVRDYIEARNYVESRGISLDTCDRLNIKYDPEEKRIVFLIYDYENNLVGYVGRAIDPNNKLKARNKTAMPVKYIYLGMHKLSLSKPTILVEGLFMYLKLHEFGLDIDYNILANLGSTVSAQKIEFLKGLGLPLYLFFDNDKPGIKGAYGVSEIEAIPTGLLSNTNTSAAAKLSKHILVYRVIYPEDIIDPDDLSKQQIKNMLKSAELVRKK
jgi:DNA primase